MNAIAKKVPAVGPELLINDPGNQKASQDKVGNIDNSLKKLKYESISGSRGSLRDKSLAQLNREDIQKNRLAINLVKSRNDSLIRINEVILDILGKEASKADQIRELRRTPGVGAFYDKLQNELVGLFVGKYALISGDVQRSSTFIESMLDIIPVPNGVSEVINVAGYALGQYEDRQAEVNARRALDIVNGLDATQYITEGVARLLALRYKSRLCKLSEKDIDRLVKYAIKFIKVGLENADYPEGQSPCQAIANLAVNAQRYLGRKWGFIPRILSGKKRRYANKKLSVNGQVQRAGEFLGNPNYAVDTDDFIDYNRRDYLAEKADELQKAMRELNVRYDYTGLLSSSCPAIIAYRSVSSLSNQEANGAQSNSCAKTPVVKPR